MRACHQKHEPQNAQGQSRRKAHARLAEILRDPLAKNLVPAGGVALRQIGIAEIGAERHHHDKAGKTPDHAVLGEADQRETCDENGQRVAHDFRARAGQRRDHGGHPENKQNVRDVGADDIAERDVGSALQGRRRRDHQFRRGGTEADDHHADEQGREVQPFGDGDASAHQPFSAEQQQGQARRYICIVHLKALACRYTGTSPAIETRSISRRWP